MENLYRTNEIESRFKEAADKLKRLDLDAQAGGLEELSKEELLDISSSLFEEYDELYGLSCEHKKITGKENNYWKKYEAHEYSLDEAISEKAYDKAVGEGDPYAYMLSKEFCQGLFDLFMPELKRRGFFEKKQSKEE